MRFYGLSPEVAGQLGEDTEMDYSVVPNQVRSLEYSFDGWLGDDLLAGYRVLLATDALRNALESAGLSGFFFRDVKVTKSEMFLDLKGDLALPKFWWLHVTGRAGEEDFGLSEDPRFSVIVSERALDCLKDFALGHCRTVAVDEP